MILKPSRKNLSLTRRILKKGGIVSIPTETYYALCTNALKPKSISKIIKLKGRKTQKGIPIAVKSLTNLTNYVHKPNKATKILAKKFWPGPLSLIFINKSLPRILEGNKKSIMARVPSGKILKKIIQKLPFPLTSTSANLSGKINPRSAKYVLKSFGNKIDLVIDGGLLKAKKPSTIVDSRLEPAKILRKGEIPNQKIISCLKKKL